MDEQLRYTTSEVLDMLMEDQDEEELDVDDPDEPIMEGSDDEFSDLEWREDSDDEEDCDSTPIASAIPSIGPCDITSTDPACSSNDREDEISHFHSAPTSALNTLLTTHTSIIDGQSSAPTSIVDIQLSHDYCDSEKWTEDLRPITVHPFTSAVGPTCTIPETPLEVFKLFFTDDLIELIVEESNRYSNYCKQPSSQYVANASRRVLHQIELSSK